MKSGRHKNNEKYGSSMIMAILMAISSRMVSIDHFNSYGKGCKRTDQTVQHGYFLLPVLGRVYQILLCNGYEAWARTVGIIINIQGANQPKIDKHPYCLMLRETIAYNQEQGTQYWTIRHL